MQTTGDKISSCKSSSGVKFGETTKIVRIGNVNYESIETVKLLQPVADAIAMTLEVYVFSNDIPLLLRLDVLKKLRLIVNFDDGILRNIHENWRMKLEFKMAHMYA